MADSGETKIIAIFTICIMLISIGLSGCVESNPKGRGVYPRDPDIVIDSEDNLHIVWTYKANDPDILYSKIDFNGEFSINKKRLTLPNSFSRDPFIRIDSENNKHIIYENNGEPKNGIYYTKIDIKNNILIDFKRIIPTIHDSSYHGSHFFPKGFAIDSNDNLIIIWYERIFKGTGWETKQVASKVHYTKLDNDGNEIKSDKDITPLIKENENSFRSSYFIFSLNIDKNDNIHLLWEEIKSDMTLLHYLVLNNRGEKIYKEIISESNNVLINVDIVVDSENNLFLFWEKYIKINEYTMQLNTSFCRKITNNGTIIFEKELDFKRLSDIEIDKNNNLHVVSKNKYRILDNEIKVITGPIIYSNNVTSVPKLALDNYDNAYIVWDFEEEVGEQTRYESPNLFQTVYCTKIINDGNISIKEKKIDSDWKKSNEMISPLYFCLITFVVFIIIAIVIIIWYKRNKRESLKL